MFADLYPFEGRFFTHPGTTDLPEVKQHYLDEGRGLPLVMLHGNPTWSFFYRDLVKFFRDRYRVIVPDHVGMGFSDKPENYPYTLAQHTRNLNRILDYLVPEGKIVLVMHDWGGAIGMNWAVHHPERVAGLVVFNTAAFPFPRIPLRINICRIQGLGALLIRGCNAFAGFATTMTTVKTLSDDVKAGFLLPYDNWRNRIGTLRFVQDIPMNPGHPSYATLAEIGEKLPVLASLPMLIQWGGRDWCFDDFFYEEWVRRFPHAQCDYYGNAGHYLLEDRGADIAVKIQSFLSGVTD